MLKGPKTAVSLLCGHPISAGPEKLGVTLTMPWQHRWNKIGDGDLGDYLFGMPQKSRKDLSEKSQEGTQGSVVKYVKDCFPFKWGSRPRKEIITHSHPTSQQWNPELYLGIKDP